MAETRGTTELRGAGVDHTLMGYAYRHGGGAEQAADDLGVERARMFKSLVARAGEELVFALVPATSELSLKKLAAAAGVKHAEMAGPRDAERATGYQVGGMSPLGSRKRLPVYLDESGGEFERICLNAGGRGQIVEVGTSELVELVGARLVDLAAHVRG
ncbi:MAG TPA: aminoacyl-tRNA deacylase [Gaiellales bacterium]|nr:aminoacyl-tRNA deacylase [Gaiellales bacterium]